jgi:RNA polymerase sigma factor (TIGR02999 family)
VHEAVARLLGSGRDGWANERQFFFSAARAMHDILVESARRRASLKRGGDGDGNGGRRRVELEDSDVARLALPAGAPTTDILALHEALERLKQDEARWHEMVMLRFFAGLTAQETADAMGMPLRTLEREWRYVRARLHRELSGN